MPIRKRVTEYASIADNMALRRALVLAIGAEKSRQPDLEEFAKTDESADLELQRSKFLVTKWERWLHSEADLKVLAS